MGLKYFQQIQDTYDIKILKLANKNNEMPPTANINKYAIHCIANLIPVILHVYSIPIHYFRYSQSAQSCILQISAEYSSYLEVQ